MNNRAVDIGWLSQQLVAALKWRLENPRSQSGIEIPWAGMRVWNIFLELNRARGSSGFGPSPLSYEQIEAWAHIRRDAVRPWEMDMLMALDTAFMEKANQRAAGDKPAVSEVQTRSMSPALFDAVFQQ